MNDQSIKKYSDMIDSTIDGLIDIKNGLANKRQMTSRANVFRKSMGGIRRIVETGCAEAVFSVGDRIIVHHRSIGDIIFTVYGFDVEQLASAADEGKHSMTIGVLGVLPDRRPFDADGQNKWKESGIRRWLNDENQGFLSGFSVAMREAIGEVIKTTATGEGYTKTKDRFFLLSRTEIFGDNENGIAEGRQYPFFEKEESRIKYDEDGEKRIFWLRSPYSGYGGFVRFVNSDGTIRDYVAVRGYGIAPACTIR